MREPSLPHLKAQKERLVAALSHLPGACTVYLFGSLARGDGDGYSDVDVQLLTTDLGASLAALPAALGRVGTVELAWQLDSSLDDWAATVIWRDQSPYHRADVGLSAVAAPGVVPASTMRDAFPVWEGHCLEAAPTYAPAALPLLAPGTPGHFLAGHLISGLRYAKARRRGQSVVCWRYAAAVADWLATLLLGRVDGWRGRGERISSSEYHRLDTTIGAADRRRFLDCLDFATPQAMDTSVGRLLRWLAELATEKAAAIGAVVPDAVLALLDTVESELVPVPPPTDVAMQADSHCGARSLAARTAAAACHDRVTTGGAWWPAVTLAPMTAGDYASWREKAVANYAGEKVRAGNWPSATAPALAEADFTRLLPGGTETPGHFLLSVLNADGLPVGVVWFGPGPADRAYLYDIAIYPQHRRRGYGRAAMLALEERVRSLGLRGIDLHVFGHNGAARALYEGLGYAVTNVNMTRSLTD